MSFVYYLFDLYQLKNIIFDLAELYENLSLKKEFKCSVECCDNNKNEFSTKKMKSGFVNIFYSINGAILAIKLGFNKFSLL